MFENVHSGLQNIEIDQGVSPIIFASICSAVVIQFWSSLNRILTALRDRYYTVASFFGIMLGSVIIAHFIYVSILSTTYPRGF